MDYLSLKKEVEAAGLFERQYGYYVLNILLHAALLALAIFFLVTVESFAFQLLNALFFAFISVRFGMLMHDAGHQQVFKSYKKNDLMGIATGTIAQISSSSWTAGHNVHHNAPNKLDDDPDIAIPLLAYTEEKALEKKGLVRLIVKYQAFLWLIIMMGAAFIVRFNHTGKLIRTLIGSKKKGKIVWYSTELLLLLASHAIFFFLIFHYLGLIQGIIFTLVNYVATGLYIGTVFATNHKGMPIMKEKIDFVHMQVLTTRNVRGSFIIDYWTGGLNYQIEHHLFQTMPRNNLGKAKKYVREFCDKNQIDYHETGFFRSYVEILRNFHSISAVLRDSKQKHVWNQRSGAV